MYLGLWLAEVVFFSGEVGGPLLLQSAAGNPDDGCYWKEEAIRSSSGNLWLVRGSACGTKQKPEAGSRHRAQVRAQPKIEQGILTLVFKGGGKHLLPCVCHTHTQTETGGLTIINELPQQCYFRLGHWNNTGLEAQLGQQSDVPLRVVLSIFCRLSHTEKQTDRYIRLRHH